MKTNYFTAIILSLAFLISACSGGGDGGGGGGPSNVFSLNGGAVSGAVSYSTTGTTSNTYIFNAVADTVYTVTTKTQSGNILLNVYNGNPSVSGTSSIGSSSNSLSTTPYNTVSFVAAVSGPVYIVVQDWSFTTAGSSYLLRASSGELALNAVITDSTYNNGFYYSFEAQADAAYQVRLTPQNGNVNIGSVNAKLLASVGSSTLTGTATDTVTFLAPLTQRYYVRVDATSVNTTFDLQVVATSTAPDLKVVVNSAISDGSKVTVNYTVTNQGLSASGPYGVDLWSDSATPPAIGSSGQAFPSFTSLASGTSFTASVDLPNTGNSGTAYAIVDSANAVSEANETNNVSAGKTWQKPVLAPQNLNFESGLVPAGLNMSGNSPWVVDTTTGSSSTRSLKAGTIGNSQSSCVALSAINASSISFDYAVSSESYGDYLNFYIDGVQSRSYSGTVLWAATGAIAVSSGVHEYKWCYAKNSSTAAGSDTAWIDNIVVTQAIADLQVVINSAVSNGANVTVNYTASNTGTSAAGPFSVDAWSNSAGAPLVGATGENTASYASLAIGGTVSGSIIIPNASANGTAYVIVDTQNTVVESNENNNVSLGLAWTAPAPPQVVYNFEDSLVPAVMVTSGNAAWVNVAGGPTGSTRSLKAGTITDSQTSCVAVSPASSTSASFNYSVSSESSYDYLRFYIDGVQMGSWSGTVAWATSVIYAAGSTGVHEYKWCYTKDGTISAGSDTAWIDNIAIY